MTLTRAEMIQQLQERTCRVIFRKIDGEERDMLCTLDFNIIPEDKQPKDAGRAYNEAVIKAFDINKQEFRSFRVENVISFS